MTIIPDKFRKDFFASFRREFHGARDLLLGGGTHGFPRPIV